MCHATGFSKEMWEPIIDQLHNQHINLPITTLDLRWHGDSTKLPTVQPSSSVSSGNHPGIPLSSWNLFADDVLAVIEHIKQQEPNQTSKIQFVGVGLSKGASALTISEIKKPGTFEGLVLVSLLFIPPFFPIMESEQRTVFSLKSQKRGEIPFLRSSLQRLISKRNLEWPNGMIAL
jgi:pimeloyl-ACP methyl ester carboxylesterase